MQYGAAPGSQLGLKSPRASQIGYHFSSIAWGSKLLASCIMGRGGDRRDSKRSEIIADGPRSSSNEPSALRVSSGSAMRTKRRRIELRYNFMVSPFAARAPLTLSIYLLMRRRRPILVALLALL